MRKSSATSNVSSFSASDSLSFDRGRFIVATVSKAFAGEKRLGFHHLKLEWTDRLTPDERVQLKSAEELARRTRQRFSGYRSSTLSHFGRNEFA